MKITPIRYLAIAILALGLALVTSAPGRIALGAPQETTLHLIPPSSLLPIGNEIEVEVWISDVSELNAADIRLTFDPQQFEIIDADPSLAGVQVIPRDDLLAPDLVIKREADNDAGTIWYAVTQLNPTPPASGSGAVFAFRMRPRKVGVGEFAFSSFKLATREGQVIPATPISATYYVTTGNEVRLFLPFLHVGD